MNEHNVIEIKDLSVDFMTVRGIVYAVQGVDLLSLIHISEPTRP